ncbi:MAG: TonB-dependent receptor [Steroidobacteraceae bacterium]
MKNNMFGSLHQGVYGAGISVLALASCDNAFAADTGVSLEEIVVTAQRYETSLQKTPVSVVAVTGDQLASMGLDSLQGSEAFLPNVSIGTGLGTGTATANFAIRGIGGSASGFITGDNGVGVYVDDILYPHANGAFLDMIDVDRVEVLRGPQGTLFGRNTAGGAIRYVSKLPNNDQGGKIKATIGTYNRRDLTATLNIPLSDTVSTRMTFAKKDRDGYIYRLIDGQSTGDEHVSAVRGQLRWQPTDKLDVNFSADSTRTHNQGTPGTISHYEPTDLDPTLLFSATPSAGVLALRALTPASVVSNWSPANRAILDTYETTDRYTVYGGDPERTEFSATGFAASVQYKLADSLTFKSLSGYNKSEQYVLQDWDHTPIVLQASAAQINSEYFTQEFQLFGRSFADRLTWLTGVFYYHDISSDYRLRRGSRDPIVDNPENKDQTTQSYAIFGQGTFKFTDIFSATAGLRWSHDDKDLFVLRGGRGTAAASDSWGSVTPKVGLEQQWTPDFMTYVSAAKGFKAGGFVDVLSGNPAVLNNGVYSFLPENLWTYEGGFRSEFMDRRIRLNGTVFYTDYKDIQVQQSITVPVVAVITSNLGIATVKGVELEAVVAVTNNLTLKANYGYLDAKYDDSITALTQGRFNPSVPFLRTPKTSYTVAATYIQPLADQAKLTADLSWGWKDDQYSASQPNNAVLMPAYGLLNGRLEYDSGENWSVAVFGTNLLNEYYILGGIDAAGPSTTYTGTTVGHDAVFGFGNLDVGRPREAGVEFAYKF